MKVFTVSGSCPFPIDMLRVERAWPRGQGDAARIVRLESRPAYTIIFLASNEPERADEYEHAELWVRSGWTLENVSIIEEDEEPDA